MDIKFNTPSTAFKTILSLIPSIYKTDFDKIKTSGNASFDGFVKGEYNHVKIPAYQVNLKVDNGFFQYPDLPQPVKNIGILMKIDNPDGITDHTVVDISKGHIEFGNDPFDFRILFKNPLTVQYIDATLKGKLNLADITRFVKLKAGTSLAGLLDANATAKGNLSTITKQQSGDFSANGFVNITGLNYSSPDFPQPVKNSQIQLAFQNPFGVGWAGSGWVHSDFVQIIANLGFLAGILFLLWYFHTLYRAWQAYRKEPKDTLLQALITAFILCGIVLATEGVHVLTQFVVPIWFVWGLVEAYLQQKNPSILIPDPE